MKLYSHLFDAKTLNHFRDPTVLLGEKLDKMKNEQEKLKQDLNERELELEKLGCFRRLLSWRKQPVKKLTESRKKAWTKTKKKFFKSMQVRK